MAITVKAIDSVNTEINANIENSQIKANIEKLAKKAAKTMKIDGFRKGHVPTAVVLKRYEKELTSDAEQDALKDILDEAIKQAGKKSSDIIGEPMVEKFDKNEKGIDVSMTISFKPSIDVSGYEKIIPEFSTPRVLKKDIEEKKNEILKMVAPLEKVSEDRALKQGDFAKFDFEGFVDGEAFEGGKAEDYVLEIGSGQFIPGFEDGMVGLKVSEEKDVNVTFPAEYGAANLAGKPAVFKVKLHEIQERKIPEKIDEQTLKSILPNEENPTEDMLDEKIKEQIRSEKLFTLVNEELKPKFAEAAVEKFKFDVPKNIVEQELDMQFRGAWSSFTEDEINKFKEDQDALKNKREEFRKDAENSVRLTFIIDELARVRDVTVSDQEVVQAVYFEAYRSGRDPKSHLEAYKNQGVLPAIKMSMIEEKLFNEMFNKDDKKAAKKEKAE
ncbi:trigger factor (peptidyl-prolyl cis /trans isomerase, chaperone) [Campylobacter pinnipediorum subsp. pinnipediorum]|uniref:trigger factor n=1 Tax=Campylobacter pinnipediorum TaxID=1965231 RepID=UPI0009951E97|nr:trigger factor [Campylobacter pinnipediorum]AQW83794.1 trigger factor (peptidyl-prolyl cis /trans isomerase, chaperone) [Campylobacter pinnipediorum subsp. pinnipediorum]